MSSLPGHLLKVVLQLEAGLKDLYGDRYRGLLLFGSYARGTAWEGSDLDLLLLLKGPVNVGREIVATESIVGSLSLESGVLLAVMPADFETYQQGETIFLRSVRKEAIPVERLERLKGRLSAPDLAETLIEISRRCSTLPDLDTREANEILGYDETGAFR